MHFTIFVKSLWTLVISSSRVFYFGTSLRKAVRRHSSLREVRLLTEPSIHETPSAQIVNRGPASSSVTFISEFALLFALLSVTDHCQSICASIPSDLLLVKISPSTVFTTGSWGQYSLNSWTLKIASFSFTLESLSGCTILGSHFLLNVFWCWMWLQRSLRSVWVFSYK